MSGVTKIALNPRGKITFTPTDPPGPFGTYVYQGVEPGLGNVTNDPRARLQLRRRVIPTDPKTPPQLLNRQRWSEAMTAYNALPPLEKTALETTARPLKISGSNLWVKTWFATAPPTTTPISEGTAILARTDARCALMRLAAVTQVPITPEPEPTTASAILARPGARCAILRLGAP